MDERTEQTYTGVVDSLALRALSVVLFAKAIWIVIMIVCLLVGYYFVLTPFDCTIFELFVLVVVSFVSPLIVMIVLGILSIIEILVENIVDCILPKYSTRGQTGKGSSIFQKKTQPEIQVVRYLQLSSLYNTTLQDYLNICNSRKVETTPKEARHLWYLMVEYFRLTYHYESDEMYVQIQMEQLKEMYPEYTKTYSLDHLKHEYERYRVPAWQQLAATSKEAVLKENLFRDFADMFGRDTNRDKTPTIVFRCVMDAWNGRGKSLR